MKIFRRSTPWILVLAVACSDGEEPAPSGCPGADWPATLDGRVHAGQTVFLPQTSGCVWTVEGEDVAVGSDGYARFTPATAGAYTLRAGDETRTIDVVDRNAVPFTNLNLYPSHSIEVVDDELWVASVYAPRIDRLDRETLAVRGGVAVGDWPVALAVQSGGAYVVVAQRAADTLGIVDRAEKRIVDAVWVGDEPSNVVLSPDGKTAYVSLATEGAVAAVDIERREVVRRYENVVPDPVGLAISPDGRTLYVAARRSGQPSRAPFGEDSPADERDLAFVDVASGEVEHVIDFGSTIGALYVSEDGSRLYVTRTQNDTQASLADIRAPNFIYEVVVLDTSDRSVVATADLTRQATSGGNAVALHELVIANGTLWVTAESSDLVIALDPTTLEEQARFPVEGRPRSLTADGDTVHVHGAQATAVTTVAIAGVARTGSTGPDPRPNAVKEGQRYFTGAGRMFATNWSCNGCHADGSTDTLVWPAGPFAARAVTRPFSWLEGTQPLGWSGYLTNYRNYAFTVSSNVGIRPTTDEAENLAAYIGSILPPPAANHRTERDGQLSAAGERGRAIYEGKAQCAMCHALPRTTSRRVLTDGITEGVTKIPQLVGIYRYQTWLKDGSASTLREATRRAAVWSNVTLDDSELDDLTRYLEELTGRDFFVLDSDPALDTPRALGVDEPIRLTFSKAVWDDRENLARITVESANGATPATVTADDPRHITVVPNGDLDPGTEYRVVIGDAFEAFDGTRMFETTTISFTTANPSLAIDGEYEWTIAVPVPDFMTGGFDPVRTASVTVAMTATRTASGAELVFDFGQDLVFRTRATVDGTQLRIPPTPIPVGPGGFADGTGMTADFADTDADDIGDGASGTLTLSGPGFSVPDVRWTIARKVEAPECAEGADGAVAVTVTRDAQSRLVFDWDDTAEQAIAFYVTDPGVQLPMGPGQPVMGGDTYWALTASMFPTGFGAPIVYGELPMGADDASPSQNAPVGGAALQPGTCYQLSVVTNRFQTGTFTIRF